MLKELDNPPHQSDENLSAKKEILSLTETNMSIERPIEIIQSTQV